MVVVGKGRGGRWSSVQSHFFVWLYGALFSLEVTGSCWRPRCLSDIGDDWSHCEAQLANITEENGVESKFTRTMKTEIAQNKKIDE